MKKNKYKENEKYKDKKRKTKKCRQKNEKYKDKNIKTYDNLDSFSSVTKDVSTVELIFPSTLVMSTFIANYF